MKITKVGTKVYVVIGITSMSHYTEPEHYSSAPDHEEVVSLWFDEVQARADAEKRNSDDLDIVEELEFECTPTEYVVREMFVR